MHGTWLGQYHTRTMDHTDLQLYSSLLVRIIIEHQQSWNSAAWWLVIKHPQSVSCMHPLSSTHCHLGMQRILIQVAYTICPVATWTVQTNSTTSPTFRSCLDQSPSIYLQPALQIKGPNSTQEISQEVSTLLGIFEQHAFSENHVPKVCWNLFLRHLHQP
jgi:hypothetical protein